MNNIKSILTTFLCAAIILGIGYLGIVDQGKQILQSNDVPEPAEYENVGSNIFYGKIEDGIEIFPWNYYPKDGGIKGFFPSFVLEEEFVNQYLALGKYSEEAADAGGQELWEASGVVISGDALHAADWFFGELIASVTGQAQEVVAQWFGQSKKHILEDMVMTENSPMGSLYFYQDILELGEKKYQVRIACSEWNMVSFICTEYESSDQREKKEWKEGKAKMVAMLERSEKELSSYFSFMTELNNVGIPFNFLAAGEDNETAYQQSFRWLNDIIADRERENSMLKEIQMWREIWMGAYEKDMASGDLWKDEEEESSSASYSCQVVELKNMILLLMQGDGALGVYYDPISEKFCGYNFFNEY